jgi:hypothetical protein
MPRGSSPLALPWPVVLGSIGDNLRMDYTAIGDTTNLAARLQQAAEPGQCSRRPMRRSRWCRFACRADDALVPAVAWREERQRDARSVDAGHRSATHPGSARAVDASAQPGRPAGAPHRGSAIDRRSGDCLSALVESLSGAPVLLLTATRPGYKAPWAGKSYTTVANERALRPAGCTSADRGRILLSVA